MSQRWCLLPTQPSVLARAYIVLPRCEIALVPAAHAIVLALAYIVLPFSWTCADGGSSLCVSVVRLDN